MTTILQIPIDTTIKARAQRVARRVGVPLNKLVRDYVTAVSHNRFEFPPEKMSKKLEKILGEVEEDFKHRRNFIGPFNSAKEAADYLRSL